jgi:hypothetical protein
MNNSIPAPTIVPTNVAVNSGMPETFATAVIKVGTKLIAMTTAMIAETNPAMYSLISGIVQQPLRIHTFGGLLTA